MIFHKYKINLLSDFPQKKNSSDWHLSSKNIILMNTIFPPHECFHIRRNSNWYFICFFKLNWSFKHNLVVLTISHLVLVNPNVMPPTYYSQIFIPAIHNLVIRPNIQKTLIDESVQPFVLVLRLFWSNLLTS